MLKPSWEIKQMLKLVMGSKSDAEIEATSDAKIRGGDSGIKIGASG